MGSGDGDIMFVFFGGFVDSVIFEEVGYVFFGLFFGDGGGKGSLWEFG